jgi:hypothetical protein
MYAFILLKDRTTIIIKMSGIRVQATTHRGKLLKNKNKKFPT